MGTPVYPEDPGRVIRDIKRKTADNFTQGAAVTSQGRPWMPMIVSSSVSSLWPSTTNNTFSNLQVVAGVRSHPNVDFWVKYSSPAAGCELRIVASDGTTVLAGPNSFTSGFGNWHGIITLPTSIAYYDEFYVTLQGRSLTAGQTTAVEIGRVYGRS